MLKEIVSDDLVQRDTLLYCAIILASLGGSLIRSDAKVGAALMVLSAIFIGFRLILKKAGYEEITEPEIK